MYLLLYLIKNNIMESDQFFLSRHQGSEHFHYECIVPFMAKVMKIDKCFFM